MKTIEQALTDNSFHQAHKIIIRPLILQHLKMASRYATIVKIMLENNLKA